jgi:hypothetical protein
MYKNIYTHIYLYNAEQFCVSQVVYTIDISKRVYIATEREKQFRSILFEDFTVKMYRGMSSATSLFDNMFRFFFNFSVFEAKEKSGEEKRCIS